MTRLHRPDRKGMTMVEMMVALAIFAVVSTVVIGFLTSSRRTYNTTSDRAHYQQSLRAVFSLMTRELRSAGCEVMLHLPMEPLEYPSVDPGPGALLSSMSADDLIAQLRENLSDVPGIKGVNNHMGSKLTAESARLYQVFSVLKKEGLFFIDSRSTPETVGRPSARLFQLPFAERDVFIDHVQDPDLIRLRVKELIQIARKNGEAIGIAHPSKTTLRILEEMLPMLKKEVQLVPASHVVHVIS